MLQPTMQRHIEAGRLGYAKVAVQSEEMRERQRQASLKRYVEEAKCCVGCGVRISYEGRRNHFCSQSCSARYYNRKRPRKVLCKLCGAYDNGKPRCRSCREQQASTFDTARSDSLRKKHLLKERGHICESCKGTAWQGRPIPLELDHTDGNSDNNDRNNLRLICPNCHALTPTYKCRNIGRAGTRGKKRSAKLRGTIV